jgi:hypothetical protein
VATQTDAQQSRPKNYSPKPETLALLKVSGNPINGLGEAEPRRPSPFFWHPPDLHPYGELQSVPPEFASMPWALGQLFRLHIPIRNLAPWRINGAKQVRNSILQT